MKLTTLMENTACVPGLTAEHGLSLFVEAADRTFQIGRASCRERVCCAV